MRLAEIKPQFLHVDPAGDASRFRHVDSLAQANGIIFLCPKCWTKNGGPRGTHSVICWAPPVPQSIGPKPGRWAMVGTGYDDLTLVAGSSSVLLTGGCAAHFFVTNGAIVDA